jgi:hypothetical protein
MAEYGEDIAVSLVPDFRRFDEEYRAEVEKLEHNALSIPVTFKVDRARLKADLEAAARELGRSTEIHVRVRLDTTAARAELARLRAEARIISGGGGGGLGGLGGGGGALAETLGGPVGIGALGLPVGGLIAAGLGAATTAVAGFTAALGTAKLAYTGLQRQAASGLGLGAAIGKEVGSVKSELSSLAQVAANAIGPGLEQALAGIKTALPGLSPEISKMGAALGQVAQNLSTGLVSAVQNASPLFTSFEQVIVKLSGDFARFTASDQFKQFISYAAQIFPQVAQAVEDVGKALVDVMPLFEALGGDTVRGIDDLAKAFDGVATAIGKIKAPDWLTNLLAGPQAGNVKGNTGAFGLPDWLTGGAFNVGNSGMSLFSGGLWKSIFTGQDAGKPTSSPIGPYPGAYVIPTGMSTPPPTGILSQLQSQALGGDTYAQTVTAGIQPGATSAATFAGLQAQQSKYGPALQALDQYRQAQNNVKQAVQDENRTEVQGAQQVAAAQQALTQARTQAARQAVADAQAVKAAEQAIGDARRQAADDAHTSAEAISAAEKQVTQAQENAADAQKNLTQARKDAARQLQDYARAAVDSGDSLQSAQLRLQQLQLNQAARLGTKTPEQIFAEQNQIDTASNNLDLKSAQDAVTDAQLAHTRAVQDNNEAQKKGVEGSDQVVAAKKAVKTANEQVTQSEQNLADTRHTAAETEERDARNIQTAIGNLRTARNNAAYDRQQNENSIAAAVKGVATAEDNAKQADDDAAQRTRNARDAAGQAATNFGEAATNIGLTKGQVINLANAIKQNDLKVVADFQENNKAGVAKSVVDIQRQLEITELIAGGLTVAAAKAQALKDLPYPGYTVPTQPKDPPAQGPIGRTPRRAAVGGAIYGPGGPTDDAAGLFALSAGEHVWTAREVQKAGGHKAVEQMREYFRGLAVGGPIPPGPTIDFAKMGLIAKLRSLVHGPLPSGGGGGGGAAGEFAIWQALRAAGYSPVAAAGVMGNMQSESGFNPFIIQGGGTSMDPAAAGGGGYGLVQWTPGSKLIPYLHGALPGVGTEVAALTAQLHGLGPSPESAAGAALRGARTPAEAAAVFGLQYERYAGPPQLIRSAQAEDIYAKYKAFDGGGMLPPGVTMAVNASTKPEAVLSNAQWRLLKSLANGRKAPVMHVDTQIIQSPAVADALVRMLQFATLAGGGSL